MLVRMALYAFLDHRTQEVGNPVEARLRRRVPDRIAGFRRVERDLDLLTALRRVQAPLVFIEPVPVIDIRTRAAAPANFAILAVPALALQMRVPEGIEDV